MSSCSYNVFLSRMCELGTKGCGIEHTQEDLIQEIAGLRLQLDSKVKVLELRARDILVVKVDQAISIKREESIKKKIQEQVGNQVMVISGDMDIEVIRKKLL